MDVHVRLDLELVAHPGAAALAGIGLLCPGPLGQNRVYALGNHDPSSLCVFGQRLYPHFDLPAARLKYYQGWSARIYD